MLQLRKFLDSRAEGRAEGRQADPAMSGKPWKRARKYWRSTRPTAQRRRWPARSRAAPLGSTAGKVSNPDGKTPTDDPDNGGRPLPPPGYRDPYKEFTKLLSPGGDK